MQAALWLAGHSPRKTQGARIHLEKNIPVAAGLGGGSSDAAAALRVLSRHWKINLDADDIERGCLKLGADVPVCWRARPTYVSGIGEVLEDAPPMPALALVIAHTKRALPTDAVFRELRDSEHSQPSPRAKLANWPDTRALVRYLAMTRNDLEAPAMRLQGEIARLLEDLAAEEGCLLARMSGSGAACFGIFETDAAAEAAAARLTIRKWWAVATRLLAPSPPGRGLG
jgi:4-diphosphocytidyl-2-C-methyl-D-erythritol kinase